MKVEQTEYGWLLTPKDKTDYDFLHDQFEYKGWSVAIPRKTVNSEPEWKADETQIMTIARSIEKHKNDKRDENK